MNHEILILPIDCAIATSALLEEEMIKGLRTYQRNSKIHVDSWETPEHRIILARIDDSKDISSSTTSPLPSSRSHAINFEDAYWPDPLGFQFCIWSEGWELVSDCLGYRPIYYVEDAKGRFFISTRACLLAALCNRDLNAASFLEVLLLGFPTGNRSLFSDVMRLQPGEKLRGTCNKVEFLASSYDPRSPDWGPAPEDPQSWAIECGQAISQAFERGFALELSGGIDSRLVLALALSQGAKPQVAITVGPPSSEDVQIAQQIAESFGIEHHVLPLGLEPENLAIDGRQFVQGGGYVLNASYSGLPATLRKFDPLRTGQIGGLGGEFAMGGYYTPFDHYCCTRGLKRLWVLKRLVRAGLEHAQQLFSPQSLDQLEPVELRILGILSSYDEQSQSLSWRDKVNRFYLEEKMRHWGGQVVNASNKYYDSYHPLMHRSHLNWTRTLSASDRNGRYGQMRFIRTLNAQLGEMPYCGGSRAPKGNFGVAVEKLRRCVQIAGKVRRRAVGIRSAPDLGDIRVVPMLAQDPAIVAEVMSLVESGSMGLSASVAQKWLTQPLDFEHELGSLISAAWAHSAVLEMRDRFSKA